MYEVVLVNQFDEIVARLEEDGGFYKLPRGERIVFDIGDQLTVKTVWTEKD